MQNCYSIHSSFLSLPGSDDLPELDCDSDLSELFGDAANCLRSPSPRTLDFNDTTATTGIKHLNEDSLEAPYFPRLVPKSHGSRPKPFSIISRLKELYHEELRSKCDMPKGRKTCYLLGKLIERDRYNMVIVTLYPINDGFCVSFLLENGKTLQEEAKYPYTQDALLEYIDSEQLPTPFLEYWEHSVPQLFYDGCVICRVVDLRHGAPASVSHVLLKPHTQSLIGDVNKLLMESEVLWSPEEQFSIESEIINNTNRSLCLDPNPDVGKRLLKIYRDRKAFDSKAVRKLLYRSSPLLQSRKRKYESSRPKVRSFLRDFIESKKSNATTIVKSSDSESDVKKPPGMTLVSPKDIASEVSRYAKAELQPMCLDFTPHLVKEWIFENKIGPNTYHVRLSILQRPLNFEFLCQMYMDNRYVENKSTGSTCTFSLGSRANANRFVKQYIEQYTSEGRLKVTITQLGPGQIIK